MCKCPRLRRTYQGQKWFIKKKWSTRISRNSQQEFKSKSRCSWVNIVLNPGIICWCDLAMKIVKYETSGFCFQSEKWHLEIGVDMNTNWSCFWTFVHDLE